jgi:hypothetical protein
MAALADPPRSTKELTYVRFVLRTARMGCELPEAGQCQAARLDLV